MTRQNLTGIYNAPRSFYRHDGYTGTNFNRPAFQKMIVDLKQGDIKVIVVKDLSRLGRDYGQPCVRKFTDASLIWTAVYGKIKAQ